MLFAAVIMLAPVATRHCHADDKPDVKDAKDSPRARIEKALARFDQAVALRNHKSPVAQRLYGESLGYFQSVIDDGIENGDLQYDAGNAALRLGRVGEAIAHYKRARALIPGDRDLERNLAFARSLCSLQIQSNASNAMTHVLTFWHRDLTAKTRWTIMIGAYLVFWCLLLLRLRLRRKSSPLFWTAFVAAVVAIAAGVSVGYDAFGYSKGTQGVIVKNDTVLRKGNGEGYQPQLEDPLPDGVEFGVIETRQSANGERWIRIELADGTDGWIRANHAVVI